MWRPGADPNGRKALDYQALAILVIAWLPIAAAITWFFSNQTSHATNRNLVFRPILVVCTVPPATISSTAEHPRPPA